MDDLLTIYKNYTQKSRMFLYSILGIPRGAIFIPVESFLSLKDIYQINDCRLICLYNQCNSDDFEIFSEQVIKKCKLFEKTIKISENECLFIFDFKQYKYDWNQIINGRYSRITYDFKWKILSFYRLNKINQTLIKKILFPNDHFNEFASYFGVETELIKDVGELLDCPNFEREELNSIV
jgi:hypothetical protein